MRGVWGSQRGVNPNVTGICYFTGKSGRCSALRSGSCGPCRGRAGAVPGQCRGWPGPLGHRVPGEAVPVLERERVYVIIGSYIMVFSTPL